MDGEIRFRHASTFTVDEDRKILEGLAKGRALFRIASSIDCCRKTLSRHIKATPELHEALLEAQERERERIEEGLWALVRARNPRVIMFMAERLVPEKYGEAGPSEDEEPRIVVGDGFS